MCFEFNFINCPTELRAGLDEICELLNIRVSVQGDLVSVRRGDNGIIVKQDDVGFAISYSKKVEFFRALSIICEYKRINKTIDAIEIPIYEKLALMLDCSRNAVVNVQSAKRLIRYMAVMGYNALMFYTEDTYTVKEYPYFGYLRGRYSVEEIREIDRYAAMFGIELIPCIQTLAHLNGVLRWRQFGDIIDCNDILLAGEKDTYVFIENLIKSLANTFTSRTINIGMDEAHMLGLGRYLEKNGFRDRSEIMLEHLEKVVAICRKYSFKAMMWSDMFFRLAFGNYNETEAEISLKVRDSVPKDLTLLYWNYYDCQKDVYDKMLSRHLQFNNNISFAGGAWKWYGFAPDNRFSFLASRPALQSCREKGIKEVVVSAWGDNGGECSHFSILPTLTLFAEDCYRGNTDEANLQSRFEACFNISIDEFFNLDLPNKLPDVVDNSAAKANPCKYLLYNDPLMGLFDRHVLKDEFPSAYKEIADKLAVTAQSNNEFGYIFKNLENLCRLLEKKCTLGIEIRQAYLNADVESLNTLALKRIPEIIKLLEEFILSFKSQWYYENKSFGFDIQEIRLGGLKQRLFSSIQTIKDYLSNRIERIEELEEERLFIDCRKDGASPINVEFNDWKYMCSASII